MSDAKSSPVLRLLPSLTDVAFLLPIVFLFAPLNGVKSMLGDGDTGYHIRAGEWILANGRVPDRDIFSFTKAGEPWFAWEWLWDAGFAWLHQCGGLAAVVLVSLLVIGLTFALLFRLARRRCGNPLLAISVTLLAVAASSIHWLARPHVFSWLFLVIFLGLLERVSEGRFRLLWWLPPLTVLWTNLHGGFFLGIVLVLSYAAGELTSWLIDADPSVRRRALGRSRPFLLAGVGCLAASFVNPYFYRLHKHICAYLTDTYHLGNIAEFQSLSFRHPTAPYFEAIAALGAMGILWSLWRRRYAHAILLGGFLHGALLAKRNIPVFVILAAPIIALCLDEVLKRIERATVADWIRRATRSFTDLAAEFATMDRGWRLHVTSVAAFALLCVLVDAPSAPGKLRGEYDSRGYPAKAVQMLRALDPSERIFTGDEWGDYVIYRLYPERKVFIDGRSDFYGARFSDKYIDVMNVKLGWEEHLNRYGVEAILLPVETPLGAALKESRRWCVVYDDSVAIIFRTVDSLRRDPGAPAGRTQVSAAGNRDGSNRGREVAQMKHRDPRITNLKLRSEPL